MVPWETLGATPTHRVKSSYWYHWVGPQCKTKGICLGFDTGCDWKGLGETAHYTLQCSRIIPDETGPYAMPVI